MYVYNDEDNNPMNDEVWDKDGHNPTVYNSRTEMKADERGENDNPKNGCWNCTHYDYNHEACTIGWNNMDEDYYNPDCDDRNPDDCCDEHEVDPEAEWEDWFGGEEQ